MAVTGVLITALADFFPNTCQFTYGVDRFHDQFGPLGNQGYILQDANTAANVMSFIQQILPALEAQVGIPLELPSALTLPPSPTGRLVSARAAFNEVGVGCELSYIVELHDDELGLLGTRAFTVADPTIKQSVRAYVEQMLPTIDAQTGIPVTLPPVLPSN